MVMHNEAAESYDGGRTRKAIIWILVAVVIASLAFIYVLNIGGFKDNTGKILGILFRKKADTELMQEREVQKAMEQVEVERDKVLYAQRELNNARAEIDSKKSELESREMELSEREKEIEQLEDQLSQRVEDIKTISKLYEQMDAQKAAEALMEIDNLDTIIVILKNIKKENTAEILENMDSKTVAKITNMMLD